MNAFNLFAGGDSVADFASIDVGDASLVLSFSRLQC